MKHTYDFLAFIGACMFAALAPWWLAFTIFLAYVLLLIGGGFHGRLPWERAE